MVEKKDGGEFGFQGISQWFRGNFVGNSFPGEQVVSAKWVTHLPFTYKVAGSNLLKTTFLIQ
jgi:hypothetical protein